MKLERKYADGDYLGCILEIEAIEAKDRSGSEKKLLANCFYLIGNIEKAKNAYDEILEADNQRPTY